MLSEVISSRLRSLNFGPEQRSGRLRVLPLTGETLPEPTYRLLEPETTKDVEIGEVGGGSVPTLRVKNRLQDRLLIIDSQTIIGLRQNRTLNTDVLVPAGAELTIPVSCVEAGRWGAAAAASVSPELVPRSVRSSKAASVAENLSAGNRYCSDQHQVWNEVGSYLRSSGTRSRSEAVHDAYAKQHARLEEARAALKLPAGTVGVAVYLDDRFLGMDLFDKASTMEAKWNPVLNSYALEWLMGRAESAPAEDGPGIPVPPDELLASLSSGEWAAFDSPGEGRSLRLTSDKLVASSLLHGESSVVHMQVFPVEKEQTPPWWVSHQASPAQRAPGGTDASPMGRPLVDDEDANLEREVRHSTPQVEGCPAGVRCARCGLLYGTVMTERGLYCNHCGHDERAGGAPGGGIV